MTVDMLGVIVVHPRYYSTSTIYPVGFRSERQYYSIVDIDEKMTYISEIVDGGNNGPIFRVTSEGEEGESFEASSPTGAWKKVLRRINELREIDETLPPITSISGPEMFGLSNAQVIHLIEGLHNAEYCDGYIFQAYRRSRRQVSIPQGDAMTGSGSESEFEIVEEPQDEDKVSNNDSVGVLQNEVIKIALFGNATGLRIRCRRNEDGYIAEDSLM